MHYIHQHFPKLLSLTLALVERREWRERREQRERRERRGKYYVAEGNSRASHSKNYKCFTVEDSGADGILNVSGSNPTGLR